MDDRTRRLGQHTARTAPAWAVAALGPVPGDAAARRDWERKASPIAAYRETYGYDHPGDPIGPEPAHDAPDQRAAWHQDLTVLGPAGGPGVRAMPDGRLWLLRDTYPAATAWAPPHPGKELRLSRLDAFDAALAARRADAEATAARKADDHDRARRHETLAASYRALHHHYQQREQTLAQVMTDRQAWEHATADTRHLAIAADAELRRRHPGRKIKPLRSAEPAPARGTQREHPHPAPGRQPTQTAPWIRDLVLRHQVSRAGIDESALLTAPDGGPTRGDLGKVFPGLHASGNIPILQPPRPEIIPSERILQLAAEHDTEPGHEAAD